MKAINEVYKSYNISQVPLAVLDFRLAPESVDINVSPDKRTVFVHSERNLIVALREALDEFYAPTRSNFAVGGASHIGRMLSSQKPVIDEDEDEDEDDEDGGDGGESEGDEDTRADGATGEAATEEETETEAVGNGSRVSDGEAEETEPEPQPAPRKRHPDFVQVTLDTTTASWSPQKRPRTSLRNKLQSYRSSATPAPASAPTTEEPEPESESELEAEAETEAEADAGTEDGDVDMEEPEVQDDPPSRASRASRSSRPSTRETLKESPLQRFWGGAMGRPRQVQEAQGEVEVAEELRPPLHRRSRREASEWGEEGPESQSNKEVEVDDIQIKISESQVQRPKHGPVESQHTVQPPRSGNAFEDDDPVVGAEEEVQTLGTEDIAERAQGERHGHSSQEVDDLCCASPSDAPAVGQPPPAEREAVHVDLDDEAQAPPASGYRDEIVSTLPTSEATLRFDLESVRQRWASLSLGLSSKPKADVTSKLKKGQATSAAGVQNRDLASAEAALSRSITKADFARMRILGQFNRGFIIAALPSGTEGEEDLYIIDQHASDEKYNFETLQRSHRIQAQALLAPKLLQLSAGDEITLLEHRDAVERNGFELRYDPDAAPGRRVRLCAVPVSRDTVFDESDLAELIHRINDGHDNPRTSKARAMFAMRACRRSVMIGTALAKPKMEQLVRNMGTIDQPWNCPHGRPTMRHLTTVDPSDQSGRDRIDWYKVNL